MHVRIATPMYGGNCKGIYLDSLLNLVFALLGNKHQVSFSKVYNESLITRARNNLVYEFLDSDADVMLFIDADEGFDAQEVLKMIESGKDLIGGVYPMKNINWDQVRNAALSGQQNLADFSGYFAVNILPGEQQIDLSKPTPVLQVGTGMMFITRKVFEVMQPHCESYALNLSDGSFALEKRVYEFFKTGINEDGILLSEDYYFCDKWRELGGTVYAAPWVNIIHAGDYQFSGKFSQDLLFKDYMAKQIQAAADGLQDSSPSSDATDGHSELESYPGSD